MRAKIQELVDELKKEMVELTDQVYNENLHPLSKKYASGKFDAIYFLIERLNKILNGNCDPKGN